MVILQVCAFAAEYPGNFIATLTKLERAMEEKGSQTIYAFPERARGIAWCDELCGRTRVYFLPEANARIKPATYRAFKKIYSENDVDIMHSHFELYDVPATVTAPKKTRIFWHLHDPIGAGYEEQGVLRRFLTKLQYGTFSKRATMLTVSEKHGDFAAQLGFSKDRIIYFPNGINTDKIKRAPRQNERSEQQFLLLGWDVFRKGVDVACDAAKIIDRRDYSINVVGLDKCEEYLSENGSDNICFLRPVTDINVLFEKSRAFLHISRAEGQSYALLEAIYAGLPVICSDIPENLFAKMFRNIYWVKTGDKESLASQIRYILDEANVPGDEDIEFNRSIIDNKYSINAWVKQTVDYYTGERK